jgi:hypothetical protein
MAASALTCPACGMVASPGTRFCSACGASLTAPAPPSVGTPTAPAQVVPAPASVPPPLVAPPSGTPPPASSAPTPPSTPPVDIRNRVDDDRGVLKRLQLLVPGYRSYRQTEDVRAADSLLRLQVADKILRSRRDLENLRSALTNAGQYARLTDLAPLLADLQRLEGEIRHAEQGYTGISPAVRLKAQNLDRLYEYDYGFALAGDQLASSMDELVAGGAAADPAVLSDGLNRVRALVSQLDTAFKARVRAVEQIQV